MNFIGVALAITAMPAFAQTRLSLRPQFAVASVKQNNESCCFRDFIGGGGYQGKFVTLETLIRLAWQVQQFQISGLPNSIAVSHFDIEGKAEDPNVDGNQLRLMLQSLLEDRFQLKLHTEKRTAPIYSLVVAKGGPKIKSSDDQTSPDDKSPATPNGAPSHGNLLMNSGVMAGNAVTMSRFAAILGRAAHLDRLVVDKTNLTGRFDIELHWAPDIRMAAPAATLSTSSSDLPTIFTAVQEQLGLKLSADKGLIEILVIDSVQKPTAN